MQKLNGRPTIDTMKALRRVKETESPSAKEKIPCFVEQGGMGCKLLR